MRFETAPSTSNPSTLDPIDFAVFSSAFIEILKEKIPTSERVSFISAEDLEKSNIGSQGTTENPEQIISSVFSEKIPVKVGTASFLLPLPVSGEHTVAARIDGVDSLVFERTSIGWLKEIAQESAEEFLSFKKTYIDPVTGLYNRALLDDILKDAELGERNIHLVLIEMFPPARMPRDVFNHVKRGARSLVDYDRYGFPLFHIGHSLFAFVIPQRERPFLKKYCLSLITYIKSRGFKKVHCGCSSVELERKSRNRQVHEPMVLDEAWTALHVACRRGPYAFCDYDLLENPEHFPLKDLPKSTIARLQRRWRNMQPILAGIF